MSESLLVTYCAPTLAGLKTGNLFNCTCTGRSDRPKKLCSGIVHSTQRACMQ